MSLEDSSRTSFFGTVPLLVLAVSMLAAAVAWTGYRVHTTHARRVATVTSLREEVSNYRGSPRLYAGYIADRMEEAAELVHAGRFTVGDTPHLFAAYISPPPDVFPEDAPILTLLWLEQDFDVDGIDLFIDGRLRSTVTGWKRQNVQALRKLFGRRYDRFIYIDVPITPAHKTSGNRDIIQLSPSELLGKIEIQLRLDSPVGGRIAVHVTQEVIQSLPPPPASDITKP